MRDTYANAYKRYLKAQASLVVTAAQAAQSKPLCERTKCSASSVQWRNATCYAPNACVILRERSHNIPTHFMIPFIGNVQNEQIYKCKNKTGKCGESTGVGFPTVSGSHGFKVPQFQGPTMNLSYSWIMLLLRWSSTGRELVSMQPQDSM